MQIKLFIDKEELKRKNTAKYLDTLVFTSTSTLHLTSLNCKLNRGIGVSQKLENCSRKNLFNTFRNLILNMTHWWKLELQKYT